MPSGISLNADIARCSWHVSDGPIAEIEFVRERRLPGGPVREDILANVPLSAIAVRSFIKSWLA
jgi:hypothetical protein